MPSIDELREQRLAAKDKMGAILASVKEEGNTSLSEEQKSQYDAAKATYVDLGDTIERLEEQASFDADLAVVRPAVSQSPRVLGAPRPVEAKREFESSDEFLRTLLLNRNDQRLDYHAAQEMGSGSTGGFMVPAQFRDEFMKVNAQGSVLRSLARELPAGSPPDAELSIPALDQSTAQNIYGGVSLDWLNVEKDADLPTTEAALRMIKLKPQAIAGTIPVTNHLLRNWSAAPSFLLSLLNGALEHASEKAFLAGDGVSKPLGVLDANNGALKAVNRAGVGTIGYADLYNMEAQAFGDNLVFVVSRRALSKLRAMESTGGDLIWGFDARSGMPSTLLGYPLVVNNRGPALGALGDVMLVDMSHYLIKPGSGPYIDLSEHVDFKRNRTVIRIVANIDGQPWLKSPLESEDETSTVSPFVALDVPS